MNPKIRKQIIELESDAKMLQKIVFIRKTLLSSGAYSTCNMEKQNINFERLNVPDWEKQIIYESWDATKKYSHVLLKELEKLNNIIKKDLLESDINKQQV